MTDKHTPGPWKTGHVLNGDLWVGPDYNQTLVCRIEDERDERHANASLIAAAPDLLAACVQAYGDLIEGNTVDIEKLDRAIAKAEGRP